MDPDIRQALIGIAVGIGVVAFIVWLAMRPKKSSGFVHIGGSSRPRPGGSEGAGVGATKRPPPRSGAAQQHVPSDDHE